MCSSGFWTRMLLTGCRMGAWVMAVTVVAEGWELAGWAGLALSWWLLKELERTGMLCCHDGERSWVLLLPGEDWDWAGASGAWDQD